MPIGFGLGCGLGGQPSTPPAPVIVQGVLTIAELGSQTYTATGGALPLTWSLQTNASGGSINSSTGAYSAGSTGGFQPTDVVKVTDALNRTSTVNVTVWNPSRLSNVLSWWRPDLGRTGSPVTTLADQISGTGNNLDGTGHAPAFTASDVGFNNQPSIQTNGTSTYLAKASYAHALPVWFFWVGLSSDTGGNGIFTFGTSTNPVLIRNTTPSLAINNGVSLPAGVSGATKSAVLAYFDASTSTADYIGVNNWKTGGVTGAGGVVGTVTAIGVGAYPNGNFKASTSFAEGVLGSGAKPSGADITNMATYISNRYAITVT